MQVNAVGVRLCAKCGAIGAWDGPLCPACELRGLRTRNRKLAEANERAAMQAARIAAGKQARVPLAVVLKGKCPKCGNSADGRIPCERYTRSTITGTLTCTGCAGEGRVGIVTCERCKGKGYVFVFDSCTYDWCCGPCAVELRDGVGGPGRAPRYTGGGFGGRDVRKPR